MTKIASISARVTAAERRARHGHGAAVVWMTGLSGAGKTTLAYACERELFAAGCNVIVLDGDRLREGICSDLTYSAAHRAENARRISEMAKMLCESGAIVIAATISPYLEDRRRAREVIGPGRFIEVYCYCPLSVCETRDAKGLYHRARNGTLPHLTGVGSPYEEPINPDVWIDSSRMSVELEVAVVIKELDSRGVLDGLDA